MNTDRVLHIDYKHAFLFFMQSTIYQQDVVDESQINM